MTWVGSFSSLGRRAELTDSVQGAHTSTGLGGVSVGPVPADPSVLVQQGHRVRERGQRGSPLPVSQLLEEAAFLSHPAQQTTGPHRAAAD